MFMYYNSDCAQMLHLVGSPVDAVYPPRVKCSTQILSTSIRCLVAEKAREQSCDHSCIITIAKLSSPGKFLPMHSGIKKVKYIPNIIVFTLEREELLSFVTTWVDLKSVMLKEIANIRHKSNHIVSFT